jgi:2,5-dioxopentanoate dehydrogenase
MIHGSGREVGVALVKHPKIKAVGFTGSRSGGRALMDAAASRPEPIPVYAEMGSINPVFVLPQALAERAEAMATGLHGSVTLGVGQFCTNPGLVFVPEGEATEVFLGKLAQLMGGTAAGPMLTPGICKEYQAGVARFTGLAGVECKASVKTDGAGGAALGGAALFVTTAAHFLQEHALMDELFGPATLVVKWKTRQELLSLAERLEGQLTGTFQATEAELLQYTDLLAIVETKVGRILFNGFPTGVEVCHAMHHGGPYPASSDGRTTSVGTRAIERFCRPLCYQNFPASLLPVELRDDSASPKLVDGKR